MNKNRFKFRCFDLDENKYLKEDEFMITSSGDVIVIEESEKKLKHKVILEPCTGLKDSQGKLVYVGDIIENSIIGRDNIRHVILFDNDSAGCKAVQLVETMEQCVLSADWISHKKVVSNVCEEYK